MLIRVVLHWMSNEKRHSCQYCVYVNNLAYTRQLMLDGWLSVSPISLHPPFNVVLVLRILLFRLPLKHYRKEKMTFFCCVTHTRRFVTLNKLFHCFEELFQNHSTFTRETSFSKLLHKKRLFPFQHALLIMKH